MYEVSEEHVKHIHHDTEATERDTIGTAMMVDYFLGLVRQKVSSPVFLNLCETAAR
jgi:hypothetical protein